MRFEVHIEDVEPALATSSENLADVPQEVRQDVADAVSALAEALGGKSHLVRFAVSGQIGESERQADSVHVSVYRGAPIEVAESEPSAKVPEHSHPGEGDLHDHVHDGYRVHSHAPRQ